MNYKIESPEITQFKETYAYYKAKTLRCCLFNIYLIMC